MTSVLFIRHGESEANLDNILVSHQTDPDLTPAGHAQAEWAASGWRRESVIALYSSPLRRTIGTAEAFLKDHPHVKITTDSRLHEIGLGRWDGHRIPDIEREEEERYRQWKADPELGAPGGGEPLSSVAGRLSEFLGDMRERHPDGLVVAATHADCLKALILWTLNAPWASAQWLHLQNVAGVYLQWRDGHWQMLGYPIMALPHSVDL